jgi:hypothetical protein
MAAGSPSRARLSAQFGLPSRFAIEPGEAGRSGGQFGIGDAPFGFDPGLIGGRLGQRQFGAAQVAVGIVERGGHQWTALVVGGEAFFALGEFAFQPA